MKRLLLALALAASSLQAQAGDSRHVEFHFAVPDTLARVSIVLPMVSEYLPPADYDRWWHEIAACEGLSLPPRYVRVRFFQVNAVHFYNRDQPYVSRDPLTGKALKGWSIGQSYLTLGIVFFALPHKDEELVVKHELLHFLLYWAAVPAGENGGHPKPYFQRCGMTSFYLGGSGGTLTAGRASPRA